MRSLTYRDPDERDGEDYDAGSHLSELAERITEAGWQLYFDVSPMFDEHWTGIPIVAAGLSRVLLDLLPSNTRFFYGNSIVATDAVVDAIARESGLYLERNFHNRHVRVGPLNIPVGGLASAGIYPSVKFHRSLFPIECSIYHDLSTLLLPQYHTIENVRHHIGSLVEDIRTNAVTFGVSQATVDDLIYYLGATSEHVSVARNGVSWPWWFPIELANKPARANEEPYILIVGTREPRKNIMRVFEAIQLFPELVDRNRFVFVGKSGWLMEQLAAPDVIEEMVARGRISFTGYVSNFEKYRLLARAEATIYPSLFEGFGLPVLESLSVGTPCIASWSSSIPEVGHDACVYFDPLSAEDLAAAIMRVQSEDLKRATNYQELCKSVTAEFRWSYMLETILGRLVPALASADQWSV